MSRDRGRTPRERMRRFVACALVAVLSVECLLNDGNSVALAEVLGVETGRGGGASEQVVPLGEELTDAASLLASAEAEGVPAGPSGEPATESTDEPEPTPSADVPDGEKGVSPADGQATPAEPTERAEEPSNAEPEAEEEAAEVPAGEPGDEPAAEEPAAEEPADDLVEQQPVAVEAWDWTGRTGNVTLSSPDGLVIDVEAAKAALAAEETTAVPADESAAAAEGDAPALRDLLPVSLPATLNLDLTLDPTVDLEGVGNHTTVIAGDTLSVPLPEGIALADANATETGADGKEAFAVYQTSADGSASSIRIATATLADGGRSLRVTFEEPTDALTGAAHYVGAPAEGTVPATQTEGKAQLATLDASLVLAVDASTDLVADEASELSWLLQADADDPTVMQVATLSLPALADLADELGLVLPDEGEGEAYAAEEEPADGEDAPEEEPPSALDALALALGADDNSKPEDNGRRTPSGSATAGPLTTRWADNNSGGRPSTESLEGGYKLCFTIDGERHELTADTAETYLGMTNALPSVSVTQVSVGTYEASAENLPTTVTEVGYKQRQDANGNYLYDPVTHNPLWERDDVTHGVSWELVDDNSYDGYLKTIDADDPSIQYLQLLGDVTFAIVGKVGEETLEELTDVTGQYLHVQSVVNNTLSQELPIADAEEDDSALGGAFEWAEGEGNAGTLTASLPRYTTSGEPIEYRLSYEGGVAAPDEHGCTDYYAATYDNSGSPNHGSDVSYAYSGGTLSFTHEGTTRFTAHKAWLDQADRSKRETVTFSLWRYTPGGPHEGSASSASHVADESGRFVVVTLDPAQATDDTVDLGELLEDQYPDLVLAKYDTDGYPYVYGIREDTALAGYETVFGKVSHSEGGGEAVEDTGPNHWDKENKEKVEPVEGYARPDTDRLTYNGGTLSNRLTEPTTVTQVKTWKIDAFADQLQNVTCTFTLQERHADAGSDEDWVNSLGADGSVVTATIEGFKAESLTQEVSKTVDRYGPMGREMEYRWVETDVTQGSDPTNFKRDENSNSATFALDLAASEGDADTTQEIAFTSTYDDETGEIVNTFDNTTYEHVRKLWQYGVDENGNPLYNGEVPTREGVAHEVSVRLYQNETPIGAFVLDGTPDADDQATSEMKQALGGAEGFSAKETEPFYLELAGLPQYSETGARYTYRVLEDEPDGWDSLREYDAESHLTTIRNSYGEGERTDFLLVKDWVDGEDAAHRLSCKVVIVAKKDLHKTTGELAYREGDVIDGREYVLSEENGWFAEARIPVGGLTTQDVDVQETWLFSDEEGTRYPVASYDEAESLYKDITSDLSWINTGWDSGLYGNLGRDRVATEEHVYEVTYEKFDDESSPFGEQLLQVNNRRIGLVDLTVAKSWLDDGDSSARPGAKLVLTCDNESASFSTANGAAYITFAGSGNTLPVLDGEDGPLMGATVEDGGKALSVSVGTDEGKSTYCFHGLPKYTGEGDVVHYTVEERWTDASHGDYVTTVAEGEYVVGNRHFHDQQTVKVENRRQATTEVVFHKEWHDAYAYEGGSRPDIYLTLYRRSGGDDSLSKVEGYVHFLWTAHKDGPGEDVPGVETQDVGQYLQDCTVSGLPRYDERGREYEYFAVEEMASDGSSLDYAPVTFKADQMDEDIASKVVFVGDGSDADVDTASGSEHAVHSGGTFVNRLESALDVTGEKLWTDIPGSVSEDDIPDITIFIQRRLMGDAEWPSLHVTYDEATGECELDTSKSPNGAVAWTSALEKRDSRRYTYAIDRAGENDGSEVSGDAEPLPLYDEDGNRYEYRAREVMTGLIGSDSYISSSREVGSIDFAEDESISAGRVYKISHGETGSFLITNAYQSEKGSLTVKKLFAGAREDGDKYPDVEFELYRQYEKSDESLSEAELVATHTISAEEFEKSGETVTYTFDGLDIYAPNGACWQYHVVETHIDGYATSVGLGDLGVGNQGLGEGAQSGPIVADNEAGVDITFANDYKPEKLTLEGHKVWNDYGNAFGTRPESIELTLTRRSAGMPEEPLALQSANSEGNNYLNWTNTSEVDAQWSYTISNLEQWAPDGSAWVYTVTETLPDGSTYRATTGTASASGNATADDSGTHQGSFADLKNSLKGSVAVQKVWEDGNDPWGLRPTSVTVELQARYKTGGGAWSDWDNADEVYKTLLGDSAPTVGAEQVLTGTSWSHSWSSVPVRIDVSDTVYELEYRVVETKVGDAEVSIEGDSTDLSLTYETTLSYDGRSETNNDAYESEGRSNTTITNTLDSTKLTVKKAWDDSNNLWGLRDTVKDEYLNDLWTVTYKLQRKTEGSAWETVKRAGGEDDVTATITGSLAEGASDLSEKTATFDSLPAKDANGNAYTYRAVEVVPGGYEVEGGQSVEGVGMTVTGDSSTEVSEDGPQQTFENSLYTTGLEGTKSWEDYGTNLAPTFDGSAERPKMTLERSIDGGKTWEKALQGDGKTMPQPTWTDANSDGVWEWSYTGLPERDGDGNAYTYRAAEDAGSVPGFYPTYDEDDATKIANVATRFRLDKKNDQDPAESLNGIELSIKRDSKTYAVWQRSDGGTTTSWVWPDGTDSVDEGKTGATKIGGGDIIGLAAGTYTIEETGTVPEDHAKAETVTLTIGVDGSVSAGGASTGEDGVVTVTVVDPVFRAHFEFDKTLGSDSGTKLSGVRFDLYRDNGDGTSTLMAKDLTTDASGHFSSVGSSIAFESDVTDDHRSTLADGLQPGSYYLVETSTTDDAHLDEAATYTFTVNQATDHGKTVKVTSEDKQTIVNAPFWAKITLRKYDSVDKSGIEDAVFKLEYRAPDSTADEYTLIGSDYTTDKEGILNLTLSKKGYYRLTEIENKGYIVGEGENAPYIIFEIENDDFGSTFNLASSEDRATLNAQVRNAALTKTDGLMNSRLMGSVEMTKVGTTADEKVDGAVFELQKKIEGEWKTVASGLITGHSYTRGEVSVEKADSGVLRVSNLEWGTYRFVETKAADGYTWQTSSGASVASEEFTIGRESVETQMVLGTVANGQTDLVISKTDASGEKALSGAEFTVTPVAGSSFVDKASAHVLTTDAGGSASLTGQLIVGNSYAIEETKAPAGYELIGEGFTVTVAPDGSLTLADGASLPMGYGRSEANGFTFTAKDTPIEVDLIKRDAKGSALTGAEFALTGDFVGEDGTVSKATKTLAPTAEPVTVTGLVAGESYELVETKAPAGYERLGSATLTVNADGTVTVSGAGYAASEDGVTVAATDTAIEARLAKTDDEGTPLAGAAFEVEPVEGSAFADGSTEARRFVTGADGFVDLDDALLAAGNTYVATEVTAPAGYELAGSVTFTVDGRGTISLVGDDGEAAATVLGRDGSGAYAASVTEDGVAVLSATDNLIVAQLLKVDGETALAGAEFSLTPAEGSAFADGSREPQVVRVNERGLAALEGLVAGDAYLLGETRAPAGYELNATEFSFEVQADGTLVAAGAEGEGGGYAISERGTVTVVVEDEPIEVALAKTDLAGEPLDGAEFALEGEFAGADGASSGTVSRRTFVAEGGAATLTDLVAGNTYALTEVTAPTGHEVAGAFSFTVGADGTLAAAEGSAEAAAGTAGYRIGEGGASVAVSDATIELALVKRGADGATLAGATFEVVPAEGSAFADGSTGALAFETGEEGAAELPSAAFVAGARYVVSELTAPDGYELAGSATFVVEADGTVTFEGSDAASGTVAGAGGSGTYASGEKDGVAVVTVTDQQAELVVSKVDGEGEPLSGATFSLVEVLPFGSFGEARTWEATTDETGAASFAGLVAGRAYRLCETAAPAGYEAATGELVVEVAADGTVSVAEGGEVPAAFALGSDGATVTVVNQKVGVTLVKTDLAGKALAGAEFTLAGTFPDGTTERSFVSDEQGLVFGELQLVGSPEGTTYTLAETEAPDGYERLEPVELVVFEDGTVELAADAPDAVREQVVIDNAGSGTAMVAVRDVPVPSGEGAPETGDHSADALPVVLGVAVTALAGGVVVRLRTRRKRP